MFLKLRGAGRGASSPIRWLCESTCKVDTNGSTGPSFWEGLGLGNLGWPRHASQTPSRKLD